MAKKFEVYKCNSCGMITEVMHEGLGTMTCCGANMVNQEENKTGAEEKHMPVVEKTEKGLKVSVGAVLHPMTAEHYIEWIEVIHGGKQRLFHLEPNSDPFIEIPCGASCNLDKAIVRSYCNLHGLWTKA